jgi:pyruvyltransferase
MTENIEMYWSRCAYNKNFGDVLGPALVNKFSGKSPLWVPAKESSLVTIGSILEHLSPSYQGTVAGIGVANRDTRLYLKDANVLALRGKLSLVATQVRSNPLLADPGLLASDFLVEKPDKEFQIGVIAHYSDRNILYPANCLRINITDPIEEVVFNAARCKKIITSSLHGLILADSLGLPRMWKKYDRVQGRGYKFHDYASSIDQTIKTKLWMLAPEKIIKEKQEALRKIFSCL